MGKLDGRKIAILIADGFAPNELSEPRRALCAQGAACHLISLKSGTVRSWNDAEWGETVFVERALMDVDPDDYDGLLLPGGLMSADALRGDAGAVEFVEAFAIAHKPIGAIGQGPWTLIETGMVNGRTLTSCASLESDLRNAGGDWVDEVVVVDDGLVTSQSVRDLAAFGERMIEALAEGAEARTARRTGRPSDRPQASLH